MNIIFSDFEKAMEERRQRAERRRLALEEIERTGWGRDEYLAHGSRLRDMHFYPGVMRTRSSSAIPDGLPAFYRSRTGSVPTTMDTLSDDDAVNLLLLKVGAQPDEPGSSKCNYSSRRPRGSFGSSLGEEGLERAEGKREGLPALQALLDRRHPLSQVVAKNHSTDSGAGYDSRLQDTLRQGMARTLSSSAVADGYPVFYPSHAGSVATTMDNHSDDDAVSPLSFKVTHIGEQGYMKRNRSHHGSRGSFGSPLGAEELTRVEQKREEPPPLRPMLERETRSEILRLEHEQAVLARRIQELRANSLPAETTTLSQTEQDQERSQKKGKGKECVRNFEGEPQVKSQGAYRQQEIEGDVFEMAPECLGKAGEQRAPERNGEAAYKLRFIRAASLPKLKIDLKPSHARTNRHRATSTPGDSGPTGEYINIPPSKPAVGIMPLLTLTPPRVHISSLKESMSAQTGRTSATSQSFIDHSDLPFVISSNTARKEAELRTGAKRRLSEVQLAKEQRYAEDRRAAVGQSEHELDQHEGKKLECGSEQLVHEDSIVDAGNSHESRPLVPSSTQPNSADPAVLAPRDQPPIIGRQMACSISTFDTKLIADKSITVDGRDSLAPGRPRLPRLDRPHRHGNFQRLSYRKWWIQRHILWISV
jgi:hypothetical protein